jgi:hypothetical protein
MVSRLRPAARPYLVWDDYQRGLAMQIQPSGYRSYKLIYRFHNRPRWYHIGALRDSPHVNDKVKLSEEEIQNLSPMRRPIVNKPLGIAYGTGRVAGHDREQPRLPCVPVERACPRRLDTDRQHQSLHDSG